MNKFSPKGRILNVFLLLVPVLLALSSMAGSPIAPQDYGNTPYLKAILSPGDGKVQLSWEPQAGAAAYRVYTAPITNAPYDFKLLAEVPGSQTFYNDDPGDRGSVVYRIEAVGPGNAGYPLAARLVLNNFERLVPVSLEFYPNTVETALSSLGLYDSAADANTGESLNSSSQLTAGMVLEVQGSESKTLTMVGVMPSFHNLKFYANKFRFFAVPLTYEKLGFEDLAALGLKGSASHSYVFTDGNNQQMPDEVTYLPGHIYGMRFDRETDMDLTRNLVRQGAPISQPEAETELLGGSPDDGTQVVVLYDNSYQTKLYKCWSSGKSGAWDGITDNATGADNVKNAAVVRRGRTMYVKDEAGMSSSTPVTVLAPSEPGNPRQTVSWTVTWDATKGAAAIQIPANAPVGDYQVRVGTNAGNYVTVYIIFDPAYASTYLAANEYRSWAYADDDWQTVADKKNYLNYVYEGPGYPLGSYPYVYGYRGDHSSVSGANGGVYGQRWVEMACTIHGTGAKTTLEAALHSYEVVGQRVNWVSGNGWYGEDGGVINTFDNTLKGTIKAPSGTITITELDVVTAEKAALGLGWTNRFPSGYQFSAGACFNYGTCLTAMNRALGIPSRCQHAIGGDGWTASFHVWSESFLDQPEIHPLDANWWDSYWYEFDSNRPYTSHTTSHSEGSICPIVISGYGDYLINEYMQCEGIGYDGSFFDNSFKCTPPGSNTGTHTTVPLETGTTNDAEDTDSYPLICTYANSDSAWVLMNLFVPWNGPARPSGDANVIDSHHGYALNDSQAGRNGGTSYTANSTNEDDLPVLPYGVEQKGVIGGWGFMMYRVPVEGRASITVSLVEGSDKVEILGTLDRNIYSTAKRWDLNYDFISDATGALTANTSGGNQLYLWVQMKGLSVSNPGNGQELAWYKIRAGNSAPYINAQFDFTRLSDFQVQFTDESVVYNDTITSWSWNFGDGTTSTQQNPTHTFGTSGYFNVTLTVTGQSSSSDSVTQQLYVGVNQAPTANFSYSTPGGNVAGFSDTSTDADGTITAWSWNFGDGGTSTSQNPSHTYASPGTYNVTLTVTDDDGAAGTTTKAVAIELLYCASSSSSTVMCITQLDIGTFTNTSGKSLYSDFSDKIVYMNVGQSYTTVIKVDNSSYTAYTRIWIDYNRDGDFTDSNEKVFEKGQGGTISGTITVPSSGVVTGQELGLRIHTDTLNYKNPCDTNSGWGEVEDYTVILTGSGGNVPPNANFTYTADSLTVTFTDTSTDSDGTISTRSWNFGDGATSTAQNPTHTYESPGTYTVQLTVTDNGGATDSESKSVTVSSGGTNMPPDSDFSFTTDGLMAKFTYNASDPDGTIASWTWNFGDGNTSTALNVNHVYTSAGTYAVSLSVTDNNGATDSITKNVTVSSGTNTAPTAGFSFIVDGAAVTFTDESRDPDPNGTITAWSWNFGDSSTSTSQNPSHTYTTSGTYTVQLTVTDNNSATHSTSKSVTVTSPTNNPPTANFTFTTNNLAATFTDTSTDSDGTIAAWSWNFGDSTSSTSQNPIHTYASAGTYTVQLTVTDDDGATHSTSKSVTVTAGGGGIPTYCASSSSSNSFSITKVTIGSFVNSSGKTKYSDFTNLTINLTKGQSTTVSIKVDDSFYTAYTRIWIDYNRDGDFNDAGEKVFEKGQKSTVSGSFTVPTSGVVTGQKLGLRIHTDTMSYKNPCDVNSGWGEVEDYAVIVQ